MGGIVPHFLTMGELQNSSIRTDPSSFGVGSNHRSVWGSCFHKWSNAFPSCVISLMAQVDWSVGQSEHLSTIPAW